MTRGETLLPAIGRRSGVLAAGYDRDMTPCRINVHVQPRAKREEVVALEDGGLRVRVSAPAADGQANDAVVALLAKRLRVPKGSVAIVSGLRSRNKVIEASLTCEELRERLL